MRTPALAPALFALGTFLLAAGDVRAGDGDLPFDALLVPGGRFMMGAESGRPGESPRRAVAVRGFYIGRREVTQREWASVMGTNPSRFAGCYDCPVENVSWDEVQEYIRRLSDSSGAPLRLPTEAEWEFAASAGGLHERWPGTERREELAEFAWFSGSFSGRTHPVGQKDPNGLGLYDMAGNVAEWCSDWYEAASPAGRRRVVRGGSWLGSPTDLRITRRSARDPASPAPTVGFRLAADAPP